MKIRRAKVSDYDAWARLRRELWPDCSAEKHRIEVEQLLRSDGVVLLAEDDLADGGLVGFAEVSIRREHVEGVEGCPVPYLEGWFVVPRYRTQGVGRALVYAVVQWALDSGFSELASDAEIENDDGIAAHLREGFREVGRTVHFVKKLGKPPLPQTRRQ